MCVCVQAAFQGWRQKVGAQYERYFPDRDCRKIDVILRSLSKIKFTNEYYASSLGFYVGGSVVDGETLTKEEALLKGVGYPIEFGNVYEDANVEIRKLVTEAALNIHACVSSGCINVTGDDVVTLDDVSEEVKARIMGKFRLGEKGGFTGSLVGSELQEAVAQDERACACGEAVNNERNNPRAMIPRPGDTCHRDFYEAIVGMTANPLDQQFDAVFKILERIKLLLLFISPDASAPRIEEAMDMAYLRGKIERIQLQIGSDIPNKKKEGGRVCDAASSSPFFFQASSSSPLLKKSERGVAAKRGGGGSGGITPLEAAMRSFEEVWAMCEGAYDNIIEWYNEHCLRHRKDRRNLYGEEHVENLISAFGTQRDSMRVFFPSTRRNQNANSTAAAVARKNKGGLMLMQAMSGVNPYLDNEADFVEDETTSKPIVVETAMQVLAGLSLLTCTMQQSAKGPVNEKMADYLINELKSDGSEYLGCLFRVCLLFCYYIIIIIIIIIIAHVCFFFNVVCGGGDAAG